MKISMKFDNRGNNKLTNYPAKYPVSIKMNIPCIRQIQYPVQP